MELHSKTKNIKNTFGLGKEGTIKDVLKIKNIVKSSKIKTKKIDIDDRDIRTLYKSDKEGYYKPKNINSAFNDDYI